MTTVVIAGIADLNPWAPGSHHVMARVSHFQELEKRFIPDSEDRIKGSHGFDDHRAHCVRRP